MNGRPLVQLGGPAGAVVAAALLGSIASTSTEIYFVNALVAVSIVVAIYVFVGNSGVLSFGHISFVAVGAWAAGVLSVPVTEKPATMQYLFPFLREHTLGNIPSLLVAAGIGGLYALLVGLPLMRLSGLAAGIATFGVLGDHPQPPSVLREDRARIERVLVGARNDRPAAGHARRPARDRSRVRLPVEPLWPPAARNARGSPRRACGRRVGVPAAADRVHALGRARGVRRRASTSICCRSTRRRCTSISRSSPSRCS